MSAGASPSSIDDHFDAIVVGSGFGGSVTAARLTDAGWRVCVLERGKAYPPGSFPRSPSGLKHNFWDPSEGLHGMFDFWSFEGVEALVSSGLGGGSLIYANVLIRKDERWFDDPAERWPVSRADLDPHYDRVEKALNAQQYPMDFEPYKSTPKTVAIREAAHELNLDWMLPNLAVTFANDGDDPVPGEPIREARPNFHERTRYTCRLVGECDVGCNFGSKNSLDYTYLTHAWHGKADIRTRCEVRSFEPRDGGGWVVRYVHHEEEAEGKPTDTSALPKTTLTADHLVLSAGTLGSPYLLLRNRAALPGLSGQVGHGFSGNGDLLTFAVRCMQDGLDGNRVPRVIDPARGPVITSAIRVGDALDGDGSTGRGFYLEDAGYPEMASWMLQLLDAPHGMLRAIPVIGRLARAWAARERDSEISGELSDLFGDCSLSNGLLPLLGMGRDVPDGVMTLAGSHLEVDWSKDGGSKEYFDRVRDVSHQVADKLGGEFLDNPLWHLSRVITVHPLGGCRMGVDDASGVVDSYGRVFNHPGLHVADGSVMPGPVGPNPSLTIAALADRFAEAMVEGAPAPSVRARPRPAPEGAPDPAHPEPAAGAVSVEFTEEMKGYVSFDGETDYDSGFRKGRRSHTDLMFHLTITAQDMDRFVADPTHEAVARGYVRCPQLGGELPVERGVFNLFVDLQGDKARKRMFYRLPIADGQGHPLTLVGHKVVEDDPGLDMWTDTTTLFTRVLSGHVETDAEQEQADTIATGILHIHPLDFAKQLTTFRVHPAKRVDVLARFGALFAGDLWEVYKRRSGKDA
jgi:cholesterol oxidase